MGRICRKRRFKSGGMKERVGDEKLIIILIIISQYYTVVMLNRYAVVPLSVDRH